MIKNVLVMCQRKTGLCTSSIGRKNLEDNVIPSINQFIKEYLHLDDYDIKFLSDVGDADCKRHFDSSTSKSIMNEFKKNYNIDGFDYIFLNTCPFIFMDFKAIAGILQKDGKLILSKFTETSGSGLENVFSLDFFKNLGSLFDEKKLIFLKYFQEQKEGEFWYRKVDDTLALGGKKRSSLKSKNSKNSKKSKKGKKKSKKKN